MDIEEVYRLWYDRMKPHPFGNKSVLNVYDHLSSSRIVKTKQIESPVLFSKPISIVFYPEYYTFIKKIKNNRVKRISHNYYILDIKSIVKSVQHTQFIRDVYNRKDILVNGSYIKKFNTISDFCICLNGLCIQPYYLNTYNKDTGFDFSNKYTFDEFNSIIHFVTDIYTINNVSVLDSCKFKDHYKSIGIYGYITLYNSNYDTDLRLCFRVNNSGMLRVKYQDSLKIEEYINFYLNQEPVDTSKLKIIAK